MADGHPLSGLIRLASLLPVPRAIARAFRGVLHSFLRLQDPT